LIKGLIGETVPALVACILNFCESSMGEHSKNVGFLKEEDVVHLNDVKKCFWTNGCLPVFGSFCQLFLLIFQIRI